jgi:hypothetical protein
MPLCDDCHYLDLHEFARPQNTVWVSARDLVRVQNGACRDHCDFCDLLYRDVEDLIAEIHLPLSNLSLLLKFFHYPPPPLRTRNVWGINKLRVQIEPRPGMQGMNAAEWVPQRYHEYNVVADPSPSHSAIRSSLWQNTNG